MAGDLFSFDIVSKLSMQEVRNAVDQAQKELMNRFDFKGSKSDILFEKDQITLIADDEYKLKQLKDILAGKFIKRNIDLRSIDYDKIEPATGMTVRQKVIFKQGISQEQAKPLIKQIKDNGLKVQTQIQGDEIRVSSKSKDELQKVMTFIKQQELSYPVDFVNYR